MAISNMGPIRNVKGVQRLTGYLGTLSWFISRLGKRGMPLYKLFKKTDAFCLDKGGIAGFGKPQNITDVGPNPRRSQTGRTPPPLHHGKQPCGERCPSYRKGGAGTPPEGPTTRILRR